MILNNVLVIYLVAEKISIETFDWAVIIMMITSGTFECIFRECLIFLFEKSIMINMKLIRDDGAIHKTSTC